MNPDFEELLSVFANNVDAYVLNVYPDVEKELNARKNHLNELLSNQHLVQKWEKITGYVWPYGNDTFLLFRAGKDGPSFNDLSENVNSLYYNLDDNYVMAMFSHEFGIFLMRDSLMPLFSEFSVKYPPHQSEYTLGRVDWMAFEMLAVFFNSKIKGEKSLEYYIYSHSDPIAFMQIYDNLYQSGVTNPLNLYKQGVLEYMKSDGGLWMSGQKERKEKFEKECADKFGY